MSRPKAVGHCSGLAGGGCRRPDLVDPQRKNSHRRSPALRGCLRDSALAPAYQRLAGPAAAFRAMGRSDHSIAVELGVTAKTIAKGFHAG